MSDKLQPAKPVVSPPATDAWLPVPGYRVLALEGRDASLFAQAQCMNDVAVLAVGHWQWNGWLTPKGRVIALFALLKLADDALWLLLPDADPVELVAKLQRFVFRSKVTLAVRDDLEASGRFSAPVHATGAAFAGDAQTGIELDFSGAGGARTLWLSTSRRDKRDTRRTAEDWSGNDERRGPSGDSESSSQTTENSGLRGDDGHNRWRLHDLEHGLPRLGATQAELWTPQMLSLERLRAYSVKKGCYPGQEIVARTHFLGKAKRGLKLLEGDSAMTVGAQVRDGEAALGQVIASADAAGRHVALAVLPLERGTSPLNVDGQAVRETDLKEGLAR